MGSRQNSCLIQLCGPIASFLFWQVDVDTAANYKFYQFIHKYREKYATHNIEHAAFTAILDGQQRLTSLLIGLCGSYAYKKKYLPDEDTERSYPTRKLHLNISKKLQDEEDGRIYEFKFLTNSEITDKWCLVFDIFQLSDIRI